MQSPVIDALSRIPLTSNIKPANAIINVIRIRCPVVAAYLSMWIDGDTAHREPPPTAARYSRDHFRALAFRADVMGEEFADALIQHNAESTTSRTEQ